MSALLSLLSKIRPGLQGKKTYLLSILTAVCAVTGFLTGTFTIEVALTMLLGSGFTGSFRAALDAIATKILNGLKERLDKTNATPSEPAEIDLGGL